MKKLTKFGLFFVVMGILFMNVENGFTQIPNELYFKETGHYVSGEFYQFYMRNPDAKWIYSNPITEDFIHPITGLHVQYFENGRLEINPNGPAGNRVQVSPLGYYYYEPGEPFPFAASSKECRKINGIPVCLAFLEFYDSHGGEAVFGPPLGPVELVGGRLVQYFTYFRLEWFPEGEQYGQYIRIGNLGRQYFYKFGEDLSLLASEPIQTTDYYIIEEELVDLRLYAFPASAVIPRGSDQSIYFVVLNENLSPVQGVDVSLELTYPDGSTTSHLVGTTNSYGFVTYYDSLSGDDVSAGMVEIFAYLGTRSANISTISSYRIAK